MIDINQLDPTTAPSADPLLPPEPAGLPRLRDLSLPGPRRARLNRGGATSVVTTMRILIRCPLLKWAGDAFPPPSKVGRPTMPARYWLFYGALAREVKSFEQANEELLEHWGDVVVPEFAAQGIKLPAAKPVDTTNPVPGYAGYKLWREDKVIKARRLHLLRAHLMFGAKALAEAIRDAEGRATGDPLNPSLGELLSGDASVFRPPSEVHTIEEVDASGKKFTAYKGSRARFDEATDDNKKGRARVHQQGHDYAEHKKHGPTKGAYYVALSSKGYDTYTRVVWDVNVAEDGQAESDAARPMIDAVLTYVAGYFEGVVYDGQIYPKHMLEIMREHGVPVINHNAVESRNNQNAADGEAGVTVRSHGQHKGKKVRSRYTPLEGKLHFTPDGSPCPHYLVSDDGAVYPADRPAVSGGTPRKTGPVIVPTALRRTRRPSGKFRIDLDYSIPCEHGSVPYSACLTASKLNREGNLPWDSPLAAHRVIPEAWTERFRAVFGARNQSESFFSWLEHCYYIKDRAASWGREAQTVDLVCAALLANAEAWAHYALRHGYGN